MFVKSAVKRFEIKTESTRSLSNFNFQWTKSLYQNNLKNLHSLLHFSRALVIYNNTKES